MLCFVDFATKYPLGKMEAAMGLMRRMPPKHSETALSALLTLLPHHSSDLLSQVDQPLQVIFLMFFLSFSLFVGCYFEISVRFCWFLFIISVCFSFSYLSGF